MFVSIIVLDSEKKNSSMDKLVDAIQQKRPRMRGNSFENFHFLQDNARPHTARLTQSKLAEIGLRYYHIHHIPQTFPHLTITCSLL